MYFIYKIIHVCIHKGFHFLYEAVIFILGLMHLLPHDKAFIKYPQYTEHYVKLAAGLGF